MAMSRVYPLYVQKAERKGRTREEVDRVIEWLTGYSPTALADALEAGTDVETFFTQAPSLNPARDRVTGVICGVRVEDVEDPTMQEIRRLDKLIDELAKGRTMEQILRG